MFVKLKKLNQPQHRTQIHRSEVGLHYILRYMLRNHILFVFIVVYILKKK